MMRWLVLGVILLFVFSQLTRLRPSKRDEQLQGLRQAAARAGLTVRFWTARNSGYSKRQLPESGFVYLLPWPQPDYRTGPAWALWLDSSGELQRLKGTPPDLAQQWLESFRQRFSDGWGLLECSEAGIGLLWQERGQPEDVHNIADGLRLLRQNLDALPG